MIIQKGLWCLEFVSSRYFIHCRDNSLKKGQQQFGQSFLTVIAVAWKNMIILLFYLDSSMKCFFSEIKDFTFLWFWKFKEKNIIVDNYLNLYKYQKLGLCPLSKLKGGLSFNSRNLRL